MKVDPVYQNYGDDHDCSDVTDAENLIHLRYMERKGLAESFLGSDGQVQWRMTEWGLALQDQNALPNEPFEDVLH